jgi:hypothetical protein
MSEFTPIPSDDELGKWVRDAWVHWAKTQTWRSPDPRWLVPWEELQQDGMDREADREIGKALWEHFTAITDLSRERDRYLGVLRQWPYRFCSPQQYSRGHRSAPKTKDRTREIFGGTNDDI